MTSLDDYLRESAPAARPLVGRVTRAPEGLGTSLLVTLDAYGQGRRQHEAFGWSPRGDDLPSAGDRVAVVRADDGELWVVGWHPVPS